MVGMAWRDGLAPITKGLSVHFVRLHVLNNALCDQTGNRVHHNYYRIELSSEHKEDSALSWLAGLILVLTSRGEIRAKEYLVHTSSSFVQSLCLVSSACFLSVKG